MFLGVFSAVLVGCFPCYREEKTLRAEASCSGRRSYPGELWKKKGVLNSGISGSWWFNTHNKNLHAGGQLLLSLLRQKFWIPDGRNVVRKATYKCLTGMRLFV